MPHKRRTWTDVPFPPPTPPEGNWTLLHKWENRFVPNGKGHEWKILMVSCFGDFQTHDVAEVTEIYTYATEQSVEPMKKTIKTVITPPTVYFVHHFKRRHGGRLLGIPVPLDTPDLWRETKLAVLYERGSSWRYYGTSRIARFRTSKGTLL